MVTRLLWALLGLFVVVSCDKSPTLPNPNPTPDPSPTASPTPTDTTNSCVVEPFYAPCCDDPLTGGIDEGYERGWPVATSQHLEWIAETSSGCVKGVVFRTGPYKPDIGGEYPVYSGLNPPDWTRLQDAVVAANLLGMQAVVDVLDGWAIKDPRHNPLSLGCAATKSRPPALYLEHVKQVVEATVNYGVIYETGNELWLCNPSYEWEQAIVDTIRTYNPTASIGSNARTGARVDFLSSHGWPPAFEPGLPFGGHWNESDQRPLDGDYVNLMVDLWELQSITTTIWPGESSTEQLQAVLEGLREEH